MQNIIDELLLFSSNIIEFGPEIDIESFSAFEKKVGVTLPENYKRLMSRFNGINLFGDSIFGVGRNALGEKLENVYEREHFLVRVPMPQYLVPFSPDGGGNFYCFDVRSELSQFDDCNIIFWESNVLYVEEEPDVIADSFKDWITNEFIGWVKKEYNYDGSPK